MPQVPTQLDLMPTTVDGQSVDLSIYQGDTYELDVRIPIDGVYTDLTGYTGLGQVRATVIASVMATLSMTLKNQTTTPGGMILSIAAADTTTMTPNAPTPLVPASLTTTPALYYWDFQLTGGSPSETHTYLRGFVNVYPQVSR